MKKILILLVVLVILGGGYWWYTQNPASNQLAAVNTFLANTQASEQGTYTAAQVATHNKASDCWVIVAGKAVNATAFTSIHPGGADKITRVCGTDITDRYNREREHAQTIADAVLTRLTVGTVTN